MQRVRPAGQRYFAEDEGTDRCLNFQDGERPSTPEGIKAWRYNTQPGARVRPQGPQVRAVLHVPPAPPSLTDLTTRTPCACHRVPPASPASVVSLELLMAAASAK